MKKGCLIAVLGGILLLAGAALLGAILMDRQVGWTESSVVSHSQMVNARTRTRLVVDVEKFEELLLRHLPKALPLPSWSPVGAETLIQWSLPREIAVLEGSDYDRGRVEFQFFVNERRGGPLFVNSLSLADTQLDVMKLEWDLPVLRLPERGAVEASAHWPIPDGLEGRLLQDWSHDFKGEPAVIEGGHAMELVLDNRSGELFTLIGALLKAQGEDWRQSFDDPGAALGLGMLPMVHVIRSKADFSGRDTMKIQLRVEADVNAATALNLGAGLAIPELQKTAEEHGLQLDGEAAWSDAEQALVGNFTLRGFEPQLAKWVTEMFPRS